MEKLMVFAVLSLALLIGVSPGQSAEKSPYCVYVMLGFHTNFYHSWRGDSNDEAGFGTDIRVVRGILKQLNDANAKGLDARGYWDFDEYFTLENIIPKNAPDIIEGIRKRVDAGLDEVLPGPYNNGVISAQTPYELQKTLEWAMRNPFGSGLTQIFGKATPILRPQEAMSTPGMIPIMQAAGIEGIILPYSSFPFTAISNFVPPLPVEQRYSPLWLKHETGPERTVLLICYSPADALNYGSPELWMRHLRKLQESGVVKSDILLHMNMDADAITWLPMKGSLGKIPNAGGVTEFIDAVNKYDWAKFTTPAEYLKTHPPIAEITVRQDTADGAFDGYFSWAEKFESHATWTAIEQSRMYSYRLQAAAPANDEPTQKALWADRDSSFWYRLIGLSTTHFGMSTPIINEERQAWAVKLSQKARDLAYEKYREIQTRLITGHNGQGVDYAFTVYNYPRGKGIPATQSMMAVRIPLIIKYPGRPVLVTPNGNEVRAALVNVEKLSDNSYSAELTFITHLAPQERRSFTLSIAKSALDPLKTPRYSASLSDDGKSFYCDLSDITGRHVAIRPYVTYRTENKPVQYFIDGYKQTELKNEYMDGVTRGQINAEIPIKTPYGSFTAKLTYTLSLYDYLPYLIVDVDVDYPYTPPHDLIKSVVQSLRRLLDLRWHEVGPFVIQPDVTAPESNPLVIWKHNYLGVTSSYSLNYGQINPKNRELDSFNHQITNGWVAVTNGKKGLLIAQDASVNALFAFAPMRLRVKNGVQHLSINPFGTFFGKQLDYSQIHKKKIARDMAIAVASHLRPSGPSFNGKRERFRLMLAPYEGNEPPQNLQNDAMAFFYPYGVIYDKTPFGAGIVTPEDMLAKIEAIKHDARMKSTEPLPVPGGLLANPAEGAIDLVWDIPRDDRITGFDIRWKNNGDNDYKEAGIGLDRRCHLNGLKDGDSYSFSVRALSGKNAGPWAAEVAGIPGRVEEGKLVGEARNISAGLALRLVGQVIKYFVVIH